MGAEKQSLTIKCGEILISVKKNKKSKVYTFNCAFCNTNCDQLKKFSLHLDEKHSSEFSVEPFPASATAVEKKVKNETEEYTKDNLEVFVSEIKVELMEIKAQTDIDKTKTSKVSRRTNEDPLETNNVVRKESVGRNVKDEEDENESKENLAVEDNVFDCTEMEYEDSVDGSGDDESDDDGEEKILEDVEYAFDICPDDSTDSDFKMDELTKKSNKIRKKKVNVDEKELIIAILEAFERQSILWNVKSRSHDKVIRQHGFQEMAKEVNEKLRIQIKWEDIRRRIKDIRTEYSYEYDKQLKGEKCEMPWYAEYMQFLKENIEALIKHRFKKKKYKRLKTLDDVHVPIFIEYYKNCEILWQVNNIGFVVKTKKTEALKQIIQDLKEKHNIDINIQDMQRRLDYLNRLYSTDKEQQLKCEQDESEFVPSSKYYTQLSFLSESQGPFKCPHCNEIIHKFEKYHIHVGEHTNVVPFKCALCEVRFKKLPKYIVHAKRHLGINKYHCDVCGKGYQFRSELEWHVREHTGEEPYLCEICGASFRSQNSYDNHIRRHEKRFRYECHICKHGFNHPYKLKTHVKAHLNIRDILCNVCGKGFTAMNHLRRHQQIHSETKRYKCPVCGKAFAQDAGLRAHRKQHPEYTSSVEMPTKSKFRKRKYNYE